MQSTKNDHRSNGAPCEMQVIRQGIGIVWHRDSFAEESKCRRTHSGNLSYLRPRGVPSGINLADRQHPSTMYVYGTHIFNLSAMTGTIILSSSRGVQGACSFCCFAIALARRQLRFLGIGYAMIPDAGAPGFLLLLLLWFFHVFGFSRSHGRSAGRCRLDTRQRRLWRWIRVRVQIAQCLRRMMNRCLMSYHASLSLSVLAFL